MPETRNARKDAGSKAVRTPETIPAELVRDVLGDLLGRVSYGREEFVITRHGKPVARLVPLDSAA